MEHMLLTIGLQNTNLVEDLDYLPPVKFCKIHSAVAKKTTNVADDVEILLSVKFRSIPFSGCREEVENVSANQRQGRSSWFSDRPEKHKLGRGP